MNKKTIWIKIAIILIQVVPIIVYFGLEWENLINRPSQLLGIGAIGAIFLLFLIFKDAVSNFYKTPGALKFVLTIFIVSGLGLLVGETLFKISMIELIFILLSLPLQMIYNHLTRPVEARDVVPLLTQIMNNKKKEDVDKDEDKGV